MPVNDDLGTRMKEFYETVPKFKLYRRTPVAIRIDGKAFHTFTRNFERPFDYVLGNAMAKTMEYLCKNIQGCVFGYTQSDEITLILIDYQTFKTSAWFDYEIQKVCSIAASMATMAFNKFFDEEVDMWGRRTFGYIWDEGGYDPEKTPVEKADIDRATTYGEAIRKGAMFDARCFNIPKEEVCNLVYWRQLDAIRNSIQMCGQAHFSHSELQGKTCKDIQDMLAFGRGFEWNHLPPRWRHGVAWTKEKGIDLDMPVLRGENREYVEKLIFIGEE